MTFGNAINHAKAFNELTKPRLSFLSVISGLVGYAVAPASFSWSVFIGLSLGMGLAAGSAATLNQWMEYRRDAIMERTKDRPIPSGRISPGSALLFGSLIGVTGLLILELLTPSLAMALTLLTLISYLLVYTPSKAVTPWCTALGTIPGALPPVIGWAASEGSIGLEAGLLFLAMVAWQIPHFMAIAWIYREDYAKANLPMISVVDATGRSAAMQSLIFSIVLIIVVSGFVVIGMAGFGFGVLSVLMGGVMIFLCIRFLMPSGREIWAKRLFFFTLIYLPVVFGSLVLDVLYL